MEGEMSKVVYVSKSKLERKQGPLRVAHYKVDPAKLGESHAATIDYVISATAG
jgi:hypothetical protein